MEIIIQDFFEKHLKERGTNYNREYRVSNAVIDFVIEENGKFSGIEVKAPDSNLYMAIGQMINFSRHFSNLFLLSTKEFVQKFLDTTEKSGVLSDIGIIFFDNGQFIEFRKPTPKEYFFARGVGTRRVSSYKSVVDADRFTDEEVKFFKEVRNGQFMYYDVVKETKKKFGTAYRFIGNLVKLGLVEEVVRGSYPKTFKTTSRMYEVIGTPNQT